MRVYIDSDGRLHVHAEDNIESVALNRMIENNVKIWETKKRTRAQYTSIVLSDDLSLMPHTDDLPDKERCPNLCKQTDKEVARNPDYDTDSKLGPLASRAAELKNKYGY